MIPRLLAITPGEGRDLFDWVGALAAEGLPGALIREPTLAEDALDALVRFAVERVPFVAVHARHPGARSIARRRGVVLHVRAGEGPPEVRFGVSAHDGAELDAAFARGAQYALLSPVWRPASKPEDRRALLGVDGFLALAAGRPVLALGGVTPERAKDLVARGARGVAVLGGLSGASPPAALRAYLDAVRMPTDPR